MLYGSESALLTKALASAATVVIATAFDLHVSHLCQYGCPVLYTLCDPDSHDIYLFGPASIAS